MYLGLGTRIGSSRTSATIQVTTPAYLDPTLLLVGEQIGDAYVAGVYPDFQGNAVSEASVTYYVDGGVVLSTYVLQTGDTVGAAYVSLTAGSATYAYWAEPTDVTDFSLSTADFTFVVPPGVGGPVLSSPVDTANGGTAATGSVSTDTGNGTLYWVVTTSVTSPSSARVKAGQDHNGIAADDSGSQVVSGTGVQNLSPAPSGLTSETTYYIHFMHENASAVQSAVASGDGFTTADVTAPTLSSPTDAANGSTAATGSVSTNEGNGTLYWVVSTSGTAPSAAQVKAGNDHTGSAAADSGSQAVSGTGVQTLSPAPSGLTASTAYTIHFMHEDASANQSSVSSGDGFTTASGGVTLASKGNLINTSVVGTTPAILTSITASAGNRISLLVATCRNTGGSAMAVSATWNGENFTEDVQYLHTGGRVTLHLLTLVAASSGTFTPVVTCSNSAAAVGADFWVVSGQTGSATPIQATATNQTSIAKTFTAPGAGSILLVAAVQRYNSTTPGSDMTIGTPFTQDSHFRTGTGSNLDLLFSAGDYTTPDTSNRTATFTSDGTQNMLLVGVEIF